MDSRNKIQVGVSSALIDLKGELIRKQKELQVIQSQQRGVPKTLAKSKKKLAHKTANEEKKNSGVDKRNLADEEEHAKNEKTYEKARSVLEAKAKLYDQMTLDRSVLLHDRLEHPVLANSLVDFQQKAIDKINETKRKKKLSIDESLSDSQVYCVDEQGMVEFVDSLGRTRKCHRSKLAKAIAADKELAKQDDSDAGSDNAGNSSAPNTAEQLPGFSQLGNSQGNSDWKSVGGSTSSALGSSGFPTATATALNTSLFRTEEEVTEMKHRKWNEESEKAEQKNNVHYQDILFDEVRTHGVAYFGFSTDTQERHEQIRELKKLSEQTKATRDKVVSDRNSKASKLKERLKNIRARKRARLGLPPKESSSSSESEDSKPKANEDKHLHENDTECNEITEPNVHKPHSSQETRPWDFGKPGFYGPKPVNFDELDAKWLKERREDRKNEFAPPSIYSTHSKTGK